MKRIFILMLIGLIFIGLVVITHPLLVVAKPTVSGTENMRAANQLYESGQFSQAAQLYQQLVDQGFSDSALFYNLGNAYFKQTDFGRAILNYRRAALLAPRDADIRANLDLARSRAVDRLEPGNGEPFFSHLVRLTEAWLSQNELAIAVLSLWFLFALLVIAFSHSKVERHLRDGLRYVLIITAFLLVVGLVSLGSRVYLENSRPEAVVVVDELNITSGPGSQYVTEFILHTGAEVSLMAIRGNWVRLTLPGGEVQGWAPANAVESISGFS